MNTPGAITQLRQRLRASGFTPTPVHGKEAFLPGWTSKHNISDTEIARWPYARNTGILTQRVPVLDIDILKKKAAEAVEQFVRKRCNGGHVLVRTGRSPKRAIPFRTDAPFKKIVIPLMAADGDAGEKLEFLADGQQVVCFGIHPDTKQPYSWRGGEPGPVKREQLPEIDAAAAQQLIEAAAELLCREFGYISKSKLRKDADIREGPGTYPPASREEIAAALKVIPSDDYQIWFEIGCALHKELSDDGFDLFNLWSAKSTKYSADECKKKWEQCKAVTGFSAGTIFHHATQASPHWRAELKDIAATPFNWTDPTKIPLRQWLYRPHYIRKFLSCTISTGGVGKSSLTIAEALAMATGKSLLGVAPQQALRVWYWNGEDPFDELQRRFAAACIHYSISKKDIGDHLFVDSGRTLPIVIAEDSRTGVHVAEPLIGEIIQTLRANKIDVLIIDPFVACHRVTENDNSGIERVAKALAHIADAADCAIMIVHHSKKTGGNEATVDDSRGASALLAATRTARTLNTMNKTEAELLGVDMADRRQHFRSDVGKANLTKPAENADWFKIESTALGNGVNGGDEIGVVGRWVTPEDVHPRVGAEGIRKIQAALRMKGPWREDRRSRVERWVGEAFAEALDLDITKKTIVDWASKGLKELTKEKYLVLSKGYDSHRTLRWYVTAGSEPADDVEVLF